MTPRRVISQDYLRAFHRRHPGITEAVLQRAYRGHITPYQWLADVTLRTGRVLDLACGSAPMRAALPTTVGYIGADRSPQELAAARAHAPGVLVRADASALPFPSGSFDVVVCSMALMILQPLDAVLAEIHRVLRPGGLLAATIPVEKTSETRAARLLTRTLLHANTLPQSPNTAALRQPGELLAAHRLRLLSDQQRRFAFTVRNRDDADLLLDSLYLPTLDATAMRRARRVGHAISPLRPTVRIPIRRLLIRAE